MHIQILIVDDHQLVLDGLRLMLDNREDIKILAEAQNGQEALDYVTDHDVDLIVMDLNMPEMDGLKACKAIKKESPETKVLILSMISDDKMVKNVVKAGADGYLLKNSGQDELIKAIKDVYSGIKVFDAKILEKMLDPAAKTAKDESMMPSLSRREKEILRLIIEEYTTAEIAEKLFISFGTVETHRRNMLSKLGARNTAGLVAAAYQYNILD